MSSEPGEDVWGDEDFLNALIQATEDASAAALSSGGGAADGGGASSPLSRDHSRPSPPPDPAPVSSRNPVASSTAAVISSSSAAWYTPFERRPRSSLPPPPPPPARVAPREPPPASLAYNGTQAALPEWEDPFAAGNLGAFAIDVGEGNLEYDYSPPRELSQREKRIESHSVAEERMGIKTGGVKNAGRSRGSGGVRMEKEKKEIERLKRELERALKKLDRVEHEYHELQRDQSKKDKELECAFSEILIKDAELESLKKEKLLPSKQNHSESSMQPLCESISVEHEVQFPISKEKGAQTLPCYVESKTKKMCNVSLRDSSLDLHLPESYVKKRKKIQSDERPAVSELKCRIMNDEGLSTSNGFFIQSGFDQMRHPKAVGIQTEPESSHTVIEDGSFLHDISSRLCSIWGSPMERISGQYLISRLLVCCATDLYVLFRLIGIPSNVNMDLLMDKKNFDVAFRDPLPSVQSAEAQVVSHLYSIMMKMRNGMAQLDNLLEVLIELCLRENVIIAYRSLCILHTALQTICFRGSPRRDNIVITQPHGDVLQQERGAKAVNMGLEFEEIENSCGTSKSSNALRSGFFSSQNPWNNEHGSFSCSSPLSLNCRILLFGTMHKIIVSHSKANIQVEAISVMNLILLRSDPISERGKLGLIPSFASVSHMLRKEVDACVKKQAVKLLFLLLNCPNLLKIFCTGHNDDNEHAESVGGLDEASKLHESLITIPRGLADCIALGGNITQELLLSKEAIILLAFIASSGKSGFEMLLSPAIKQRNFLELIVEVLAFLMDMQVGGLDESQDFHKERTALIREALILLNRLASHTLYSKTTMEVLTRSTTMATLTVDVANRICHKTSCCKHESTKRAQIEAEIVDLARLFKTRILSFLGEDST